jgi:very-short-patch-repair endonuclease
MTVAMNRRPGRRDQRARYPQRRTEVLAAHGYRLVRVWHHELTIDLVRRKLLDAHVEAAPPAR